MVNFPLLIVVAENEDTPTLEVWSQLVPPFALAAVIARRGEPKRAEIVRVLFTAGNQNRRIAAL